MRLGTVLACFVVSAPGLVRAQEEVSLEAGQKLYQQGDVKGATEVFRKFVQQHPDNGEGWHWLGVGVHVGGNLDAALPYHLMAAEFAETNPDSAARSCYNAACVYSLKGKLDKAMSWLERARDGGFFDLQLLRTDGDLAIVRKDPRFRAYIAQGPSKPVTPDSSGGAEGDEVETPADPGGAKRFDFYAGTWDVAMSGGKGTNMVTRILDGKAIREELELTLADGSSYRGLGLLVFDEPQGIWRHTWIDNQGRYLTSSGGWVGGLIVLYRTEKSEGGTIRHRMTFHDLAGDSLKWAWETSRDGGKTWSPIQRLAYTRR